MFSKLWEGERPKGVQTIAMTAEPDGSRNTLLTIDGRPYFIYTYAHDGGARTEVMFFLHFGRWFFDVIPFPIGLALDGESMAPSRFHRKVLRMIQEEGAFWKRRK